MLLDLQQGSPEWLDWRKTKITASMVPIIMGASKYMTPYQLFCELTGLTNSKDMTFIQKKGHEKEIQARHEFNHLMKSDFQPAVIQSDEHDWLAASVDGYHAWSNKHVEIKMAEKEDHELVRAGKLPEHYKPQFHAQLIALNHSSGYYYSFKQKEIEENNEKVLVNDSLYLLVKSDSKYETEIIEKCLQFKHFLDNCIPPPLTDKDHAPIQTQEWETVAQETLTIQDQIKILENKLDANKKVLEKLSEGRSCIGGGIKWTKSARVGSVDYASIPQLKGINLDEYRKPSSFYYRIGKE